MLRRYSEHELGVLDSFLRYYTERLRNQDITTQPLRNVFNNILVDINIAIEEFKYDVVLGEEGK